MYALALITITITFSDLFVNPTKDMFNVIGINFPRQDARLFFLPGEHGEMSELFLWNLCLFKKVLLSTMPFQELFVVKSIPTELVSHCAIISVEILAFPQCS